MFRLIRPADFFTAISGSPRLKVTLAGLTFGGLVLPSAFLMSFGFSERYVLPLMLTAIPAFQYVAFCVLEALDLNDGIGVMKKTGMRKGPVLVHDIRGVGSTMAESEALQVWLGSRKSTQLAPLAIYVAEYVSVMERMRCQREQIQIQIDSMRQLRPSVGRPVPFFKVNDLQENIITPASGALTAVSQASRIFKKNLSGSYSKSTVTFPMTDIDVFCSNLGIIFQAKTQNELIELQRKPLDTPTQTPTQSIPSPSKLISNLSASAG